MDLQTTPTTEELLLEELRQMNEQLRDLNANLVHFRLVAEKSKFLSRFL